VVDNVVTLVAVVVGVALLRKPVVTLLLMLMILVEVVEVIEVVVVDVACLASSPNSRRRYQ